MLLNLKVTEKNTHFTLSLNICWFPKRRILTYSTYLTYRKKWSWLFSFQIIKSNTSRKFLLLSVCWNKLFCKWALLLHAFILSAHTQKHWDACFCTVFLSSLTGPSHMSDTDYLMSQPISWLNSRRMWNCLTSLQMRIAACRPNRTRCSVSTVPVQWLQVSTVRQIQFLELWLHSPSFEGFECPSANSSKFHSGSTPFPLYTAWPSSCPLYFPSSHVLKFIWQPGKMILSTGF